MQSINVINKSQSESHRVNRPLEIGSIKMGCVDVNETAIIAVAFVCVTSHMIGFNTHSVRLHCAIPKNAVAFRKNRSV